MNDQAGAETGDSIRIDAPAKINLHLSVTGKRPDGYHLLDTLMVKVDLADRLEIRLTDGPWRIRVEPAGAPADESNLVIRAAKAFRERTGVPFGLEVDLFKHIPVAAGLGGGSSDAAAALIGFNRLCGRLLDPDQLAGLALTVGADVPFFIRPEPVLRAGGVGHQFRPAGLSAPGWFVLVNPGWPLSTAWVFGRYKIELTKRRQNHIFSGLHERDFTIESLLHNDLEKVVLPAFPEIERIKQALTQAGAAGAVMTGSGPTVVGVYDGGDRAAEAAARLNADHGDRWWIRAVKTAWTA
jgi:4-diphosphocytidyl-2-C-methyl-D-erythritol kinase